MQKTSETLKSVLSVFPFPCTEENARILLRGFFGGQFLKCEMLVIHPMLYEKVNSWEAGEAKDPASGGNWTV